MRENGEAWILSKGIGCLSLDFYEGRGILIYSPGLFAGVGSKIILPYRDQQCSIWDAESLGIQPAIIESHINGTFQGWDGDTIFELRNGQVWQQASYSYAYHYAYSPEVFIYSTSGGYKMIVNGVSETIYVRRYTTPITTQPPAQTPTPTPTPSPNTWIDAFYATNGELPPVPDWLAPLIPELEAGERIRKDVTMTFPSMQYWAMRSPTEKEMIMETVSWLGGNRTDYLWEIGQMAPP